jgi:hypothetical protein
MLLEIVLSICDLFATTHLSTPVVLKEKKPLNSHLLEPLGVDTLAATARPRLLPLGPPPSVLPPVFATAKHASPASATAGASIGCYSITASATAGFDSHRHDGVELWGQPSRASEALESWPRGPRRLQRRRPAALKPTSTRILAPSPRPSLPLDAVPVSTYVGRGGGLPLSTANWEGVSCG